MCTLLWKRYMKTSITPNKHTIASDLLLRAVFIFSLSAVDVSAAQSVLGRPDQAASGWRWRLALQTQDRYRSPHLTKQRPSCGRFSLVSAHRFLTLCLVFVLQTCVNKSPSWTQKRVNLFVQCSNMSVSSTSSMISHLHASWRETIFCPLVR